MATNKPPPPVDVLIFKALLFTEVGIERRRYVCRSQRRATICSAFANFGGNSLPRFAARRRIP